MGGLFDPWTDHPPQLQELRVKVAYLDRVLTRLIATLEELQRDVTALTERSMGEPDE